MASLSVSSVTHRQPGSENTDIYIDSFKTDPMFITYNIHTVMVSHDGHLERIKKRLGD
jgi:hypothetical protein